MFGDDPSSDAVIGFTTWESAYAISALGVIIRRSLHGNILQSCWTMQQKERGISGGKASKEGDETTTVYSSSSEGSSSSAVSAENWEDGVDYQSKVR